MNLEELKCALAKLSTSRATLLWLEGSKISQVSSVKLLKDRLVLGLLAGTTRMIKFERFCITKVGLQFWYKGKPGVLYLWDMHKSVKKEVISEQTETQSSVSGDGEPPAA